MAGLFKETELRKFTFEDKLRWALRTIVNSCNPKEDYKHRDSYFDTFGKKRSYSFPVCFFNIPKKLPESEFDDLKFWIEDEMCFIELPGAKYQFHLSMLLRVQKGLMKAIGKR